jgi:hypothetical protein
MLDELSKNTGFSIIETCLRPGQNDYEESTIWYWLLCCYALPATASQSAVRFRAKPKPRTVFVVAGHPVSPVFRML